MLSLYLLSWGDNERMDILSRPVLPADHRIHYGDNPCQFGDLWLPAKANAKTPVIVFIHGGWWKSAYDLGYAGYLCDALKRAGIACWSLEYRRVGATGGGWPATFQDVAAGFEHLSEVARTYPLDLTRVFTMGHSAGGHLAFWLAGRYHIDAHSEAAQPKPVLPIKGAIALAGAVGLKLTIQLSGDGVFAHDRDEVAALMGGTPEQFPERYKAGDPGLLLPFAAPQLLIQGTRDSQIPPQLPAEWANLAQQRGSSAAVHIIPDADHFDIVDPESQAWPEVMKSVLTLMHAH
jgi:acetyl esterase/lipase